MSNNQSATIVQRLWNYCNVPRGEPASALLARLGADNDGVPVQASLPGIS